MKQDCNESLFPSM